MQINALRKGSPPWSAGRKTKKRLQKETQTDNPPLNEFPPSRLSFRAIWTSLSYGAPASSGKVFHGMDEDLVVVSVWTMGIDGGQLCVPFKRKACEKERETGR